MQDPNQPSGSISVSDLIEDATELLERHVEERLEQGFSDKLWGEQYWEMYQLALRLESLLEQV